MGLFWYSERPIWYADAKEHRVLSWAASSFGAAPAREGGPPCGAARRLSRAGMSGTHGTPRAPPPGSVSRAAPACATTFGASLAEGPCRTAAGGGDWSKIGRLAARSTSDGEPAVPPRRGGDRPCMCAGYRGRKPNVPHAEGLRAKDSHPPPDVHLRRGAKTSLKTFRGRAYGCPRIRHASPQAPRSTPARATNGTPEKSG